MSKNTNHKLKRAKQARNDEFYTFYENIHKEVKNYSPYLKNKRILCNCDDYRVSNFYKYFKDYFIEYELKSVTAVSYSFSNLFIAPEPAYKAVYDGVNEYVEVLSGDGDYRSPEQLELLDMNDVVITNPPFSQLTHYSQLLESHPSIDFLYLAPLTIIGRAGVTYKPTSRSRMGYVSGAMYFHNSNKPVGCVWITSLPTPNKIYRPFGVDTADISKFNFYDNYPNILNIDSVKDIPLQYEGLMGVPIRAPEYINPKDYEILGSLHTKHSKPNNIEWNKRPRINGEQTFNRLIIKKKI